MSKASRNTNEVEGTQFFRLYLQCQLSDGNYVVVEHDWPTQNGCPVVANILIRPPQAPCAKIVEHFNLNIISVKTMVEKCLPLKVEFTFGTYKTYDVVSSRL